MDLKAGVVSSSATGSRGDEGPSVGTARPKDGGEKVIAKAAKRGGSKGNSVRAVEGAGGEQSTKAVKKAKGDDGSKGPRWSYEYSRSQIMCRTGKSGPGQNHAIKFSGNSGKTKTQATIEAEAWLKKELVRQGRM